MVNGADALRAIRNATAAEVAEVRISAREREMNVTLDQREALWEERLTNALKSLAVHMTDYGDERHKEPDLWAIALVPVEVTKEP